MSQKSFNFPTVIFDLIDFSSHIGIFSGLMVVRNNALQWPFAPSPQNKGVKTIEILMNLVDFHHHSVYDLRAVRSVELKSKAIAKQQTMYTSPLVKQQATPLFFPRCLLLCRMNKYRVKFCSIAGWRIFSTPPQELQSKNVHKSFYI